MAGDTRCTLAKVATGGAPGLTRHALHASTALHAHPPPVTRARVRASARPQQALRFEATAV